MGEATMSEWSELSLRLTVHALERGQMVWSLNPGLSSQPSWTRWLTFGAWVTHPCFRIGPETITESHSAPATDTPSLPPVQQCMDDTLFFFDPSIPNRTLFFRGKSFPSISRIRRVCKQCKWERWQMVLQSLDICKVRCSVLFLFFVRDHFNAMCGWMRQHFSPP